MAFYTVFNASGLTGYRLPTDRKNGEKLKKTKGENYVWPPTIPATGGGLALLGLAYGSYIGNWIVILFSIALIALILLNIIRLRRGEQKIIERDK
jgi:hypothetical protein